MNKMTLPAVCMVCGETSSTGFHCGAVTCEACKKFFKRNYDGDYKQCIRSTQNCVVSLATRTACGYCRYKKCEQVGMKQNEKAPSQVVSFKKIPCAVCSDASSGLHFGVITCEGCKGFFRRNANEGDKFVCISDRNCKINVPNRNVCKACRLNKCKEVGMNLKNSKIGRQTNLFKQNLISAIDRVKNESNSNVDYSIVSYDQHYVCNIENIEDTLDYETRNLVKTVFETYKESFELSNDTFQYEDFNLYQFPEQNLIFKSLRSHIDKCISFLFKISTIFQQMPESDRVKVIANAIHPIRMLQLAHNPANIDYFNLSSQSFEINAPTFTNFASSNSFFDLIKDFIQRIKLDAKEFALFSAHLAFSSGGHGFSLIPQSYGLNLKVCNALVAYMKLRRNEYESAEALICYGFNFEKINHIYQSSIYQLFKKIEKCVLPHTYYHAILYSSFEATNQSSQNLSYN